MPGRDELDRIAQRLSAGEAVTVPVDGMARDSELRCELRVLGVDTHLLTTSCVAAA